MKQTPGMTARPCLTCGQITTNGSYCPKHSPPPRKKDRPHRTAEWQRLSSRLLRDWRRRIGDLCPGAPDLGHRPHRSTDLTVDHIDQNPWNNDPRNLRILCRSFNSRRSRSTTPIRGGGGSTS